MWFLCLYYLLKEQIGFESLNIHRMNFDEIFREFMGFIDLFLSFESRTFAILIGR